MEGFIDIHSHLIPNTDDGSRSMEQTKNMIRIAYAEGIRTLVATPHYYEGRYECLKVDLEDRLNQVRREIKDFAPQMSLYLGSEIYYTHESVGLLKEKAIPTLADSQYILVEFSPMSEYSYIRNGLQEFQFEGYSPILAHVERYMNITCDVHRIEELIEMGAYLQVNTMSITGETGKSIQKITKKLLKEQYIHFIATDAHSDGSRSPRMKKCYETIAKKYGKDYAKELFIENPKKVIENQDIIIDY